MYILNVSDTHPLMACIIDGGTLFSARDVVPLALSDWLAVSELKNWCKHHIKKDQVGMVPLLVSHKGGLNGNSWLWACKYVRKCVWGSCAYFCV